MSLDGKFKTVECGRCRGTGVRYCCGNRDAEMTCNGCGGAGSGLVWVAEPEEGNVAIELVEFDAVDEDGKPTRVKLRRAPQPGRIDLGTVGDDGATTWKNLSLADFFTGVQSLRNGAGADVEPVTQQEARRA